MAKMNLFTSKNCMTFPTKMEAKRVCTKKLIFLFLNLNICCGYSKEPSKCDSSFEHPKLMLNQMGEKIFTILCCDFKPVIVMG